MVKDHKPDPTVIIIFGAGGDLTWRKLVPAVYHLQSDGWLDERFAILGVDRKPMSDDEFRQHLRKGAEQALRSGPVSEDKWNRFAPHLHYQVGDLGDSAAYQKIREFCKGCETDWKTPIHRVFYL